MSVSTGIQWCDATFNPWWGCERVSPACAHCYADTLASRFNDGLWTRESGEHGFRFFGDKHWAEPLRWARTLPVKLGRRPRVFCASMADVFEDRPELDEPRARLFDLIGQTPELDWLLLTKRPELAGDILGNDLIEYPNVWLGVSIENARYTWRADVLREIPASFSFISAEPLLGSLFESGGRREPLNLDGIDWVIIGGESGPGARPFRLEHAREILDHVGARAPFETRERPAVFVKQLGAKPLEASNTVLLGDRKGGNPDEWPLDLRLREFPRIVTSAV